MSRNGSSGSGPETGCIMVSISKTLRRGPGATLYWLLGTSVRKIVIFVFSSSLFAWRAKPERGKSKDVLLALPEKKPQAYEKNRRLRGRIRLGKTCKDGRESFHRYLRT